MGRKFKKPFIASVEMSIHSFVIWLYRNIRICTHLFAYISAYIHIWFIRILIYIYTQIHTYILVTKYFSNSILFLFLKSDMEIEFLQGPFRIYRSTHFCTCRFLSFHLIIWYMVIISEYKVIVSCIPGIDQ